MMRSLYVHIPFCKSKCPYCDFTSFSIDVDWRNYLDLLLKEFDFAKPLFTSPLDTVYFGGGTPSILPVEFYESFIKKLEGSANLVSDPEISLEANPGTLDKELLTRARGTGINRLSIGIQSFNDAELQTLGREHSSKTGEKSVREARQSGLNNISIDLMFGIPGQTPDTWRQSLKTAADLGANHVSIYPLTISNGCSWNYEKNGYLPVEDLVADMYEEACDILEAAGLKQYEISNFALPGYECKHNLNYWNGGDYVGLGVSAHSKIKDTRYWNTIKFGDYKQALLDNRSPVNDSEKLDTELLLAEKLILNLRLNKGVDLVQFTNEHGPNSILKLDPKLKHMAEIGMLSFDQNNVKLTRQARFIANEVFLRLLPDPSLS